MINTTTRRPQEVHELTPSPAVIEPGTTPVYGSTELFQRGRLVWIAHGGERYALRITKQGKLILTK